jgi:hypothetical protein
VTASSGIDPVSGAWSPAFEGQKPPFEPGNQLAIRHGAYSTLSLAPRAAELADEIRRVVPVYSPADEILVRSLALALARVERAQAALDQVDDQVGNELGTYLHEKTLAFEHLRSDMRAWLNLVRKLTSDLGMSPTARARLGVDLTVMESGQARLNRYLAENYGDRSEGSS